MVHIKVDLAGSLRSVAVKDNAALAAELADTGNILNDADFVIHRHDRDKRGVRANGIDQVIPADHAFFVNVKIRHFVAFAFEVAHAVEHGLVFGLDRNKVLALVAIEVRCTLDCQIVSFRCAGRKYDFARIRTDQRSNLRAAFFNGLLSFPAVAVAVGGGVPKMIVQIGNELFDHAGIARRRSGVVEVNRKLHD